MCESSVFLVKGEKRELVMNDVVKVSTGGDAVTCTNILGETKTVAGRLSEINLVGHSVTIVAS